MGALLPIHSRQRKPSNLKCWRYRDVLVAHIFTVPAELFPPCPLFMYNCPSTASCRPSHPSCPHWRLGQRNAAHLLDLLLLTINPLTSKWLTIPIKARAVGLREHEKEVGGPRLCPDSSFCSHLGPKVLVPLTSRKWAQVKQSWSLLMLSRTCPPKTSCESWHVQSYIFL